MKNHSKLNKKQACLKFESLIGVSQYGMPCVKMLLTDCDRVSEKVMRKSVSAGPGMVGCQTISNLTAEWAEMYPACSSPTHISQRIPKAELECTSDSTEHKCFSAAAKEKQKTKKKKKS